MNEKREVVNLKELRNTLKTELLDAIRKFEHDSGLNVHSISVVTSPNQGAAGLEIDVRLP
jgi:hypothetical protein